MRRLPYINPAQIFRKSYSQSKRGKQSTEPSPRSSTQRLLERLASAPKPPKPQPKSTEKLFHPLRYYYWQRPAPGQSPWTYDTNNWNPYDHSHLPARYKWWYAFRQIPQLVTTIVALGLLSSIRWLVNPSPPKEKHKRERSLLGSAVYRSLARDGPTRRAIDDTIRPWGRLSKNTGESNKPTFTGDREIIYCSFKRIGGQGLKVGQMISLVHPIEEDAYLHKRVRALGGDCFNQEAAPSKRASYSYTVEVSHSSPYIILHFIAAYGKAWLTAQQVPQGYCFVLGDNFKNSRDSRMFGAIPLDSIVSTTIWRWGVDGFNWIDHSKQPWRGRTQATAKLEKKGHSLPMIALPKVVAPTAKTAVRKTLPRSSDMVD